MGTLNKPELKAFLEAAGIRQVAEVRSLMTEDVDQLLGSKEKVRCVVTGCFDESLSWLPSGEQDRIWREEIRPRLASLTVRDWSGYYEATEWRTGQHECVIEFMHCYAPI